MCSSYRGVDSCQTLGAVMHFGALTLSPLESTVSLGGDGYAWEDGYDCPCTGGAFKEPLSCCVNEPPPCLGFHNSKICG